MPMPPSMQLSTKLSRQTPMLARCKANSDMTKNLRSSGT